jgi:hypothetical protein
MKRWHDSHHVPSQTVQAQVVVMEEIDEEDVRVWLPMHEENGFVERLQAQHFAEVMANEEGWEYVN